MNQKMMKTIAGWLVVIGGLNWGLIGLLNLNLVDSVLGVGSLLSRIVYILVGVSAVYVAMMMSQKKMK